MRWLVKLMLILGLMAGLSSNASAETYMDRWCINNTSFNQSLPTCYPTSGEVIQAYWAVLSPVLNANEYFNTTYWGENRATLDGCELKWPGPPPILRCTVTRYFTQHSYGADDHPLVFAPTQGWFGVAMTCGEAEGSTYIASLNKCAYVKNLEKADCGCNGKMGNPSVGNPVTPLDGLKHQTEELLRWGRGQAVTVSYNYLRESVGQPLNRQAQSGFGPIWSSNHHKSSVQSQDQNGGAYVYRRPSGTWKTFYTSPGWTYSAVEADPQPKFNGASGYWYYDASEEAIENYQSVMSQRNYGTSVSYIDGRKLTYGFGNVPLGSGAVYVLQTITDESGRQVSLSYERDPAINGAMRVLSMTDPAGSVYGFTYGSKGQLASIHYPDQTSRQYKYEVDGKPWLMTALIDEAGSAYGRYGYDSEGRAISTRTGETGPQWSIEWSQAPAVRAASTYDGTFVYRTLSFPQPSVAQLHGPDGYEETLSSTQVDGVTLVGSRVQPAGAGSPAATVQYERDAEGNIVRNVEANGLQSCHSFVSGRKAESSRVEGLPSGATCSTVLVANAALPAGARKVSSLWHPVWRKQVRIAEPNRVTTLVYNGQPDPTNGNAVASCAPSTAKLPDNSLIVVLCKRVEQVTTDATGALGFSAVAQTGVPARVWTWTYDATGHVLSETDPLGKTTTNEYYADTTADHWIGDLKSSTNAAGHVTNYLRYNALGKLLEMVDANGISTVYTYDVRSRLTSVTQADQTTSYAYWPTGLLKQVTQPDGSTVSYDYDDAHRLVAVADNLGNRIQYTLDQRGNRVNEAVQDPSGALQRNLGRVFDALSRTQQTTGAE
ncbi:hypothetical protein OU995_05995 [Roseateles sp. SL47]|uniref:RHS repeat domain-containing protein n=1 Tax=Roseateles sp. SL47 TaxID=2995138 RepID=UPI00226D7444|nr:hypothetical protein [Roseateles sp. SL47]WAC74272.1 hypothetical protein OU995_05995 [Roseateles sp. SL47]